MAKKQVQKMNKSQFARLYFNKTKTTKTYETESERQSADKLFRHFHERGDLDAAIVETCIAEYLREQEKALREWLFPAK